MESNATVTAADPVLHCSTVSLEDVPGAVQPPTREDAQNLGAILQPSIGGVNAGPVQAAVQIETAGDNILPSSPRRVEADTVQPEPTVQVANPAQGFGADPPGDAPATGDKGPRPRRVAWDLQPDMLEVPCSQGVFPLVCTVSFKGSSLDAARRQVDRGIVRKSSKSRHSHLDQTPDTQLQPSGLAWLRDTAASWLSWWSCWVLRCGGVLPFSAGHFWPSLMYQWLVLVFHIALLAVVVADVQATGASLPFQISDLVVSGGSVCGLLAIGVATDAGLPH